MIAGLRGEVLGFGPARVFVLAGGVVYEVHTPLPALSTLQSAGIGSAAELEVYHHFAEYEQRLFGFLNRSDRELFIQLQNLKGVGVSLALSLLSHLDGASLLRLCGAGDLKALQRIPRVGKATAETLVFEVNRRADRWRKLISEPTAPASALSGEQDLAFQALLQLGYKDKEALRALQAAADSIGSEAAQRLAAADWIGEALRRI
ncbi:MAG: hypothetical protein K1X75_03365 [Leptospirales bacterium]|nr:hypothetical protein [Leptospirales bacterium]